jgi:hypothetical protein
VNEEKGKWRMVKGERMTTWEAERKKVGVKRTDSKEIE